MDTPPRSGAQWYTFRVEDLPPELAGAIREVSPRAAVVCWHETTASWGAFTEEGAPAHHLPLPPNLGVQVLSHAVRLRRAEPHLCLHNGHTYYYLDPESSYCQISDLAANLKGQNRYCGAVSWTVAQHLDLCGEMAAFWKEHFDQSSGSPRITWELPAVVQAAMGAYTKAELVTAVEIHDLAEGVMHDLNAGLKRALRQMGCEGSQYDNLETLADGWVRRRYPTINYSAPLHEFVKWIDRRAAWIEMVKLRFAPVHLEEVQESCDGACQPLLQAELSLFCSSRVWRDF